MKRAAGILALLVASCSGGAGGPAAARSPAAVTVPAHASPVASGTSCTSAPPSNHVLALVTLAGSHDVVVRDVTDISAANTICTMTAPGAGLYQFAGPGKVSYGVGELGAFFVVDLASGTTQQAFTIANPRGFMAGLYAWSGDGSSVSWLESDGNGVNWHLKTNGADKVVATLPPVPGRGINAADDDAFLGFSADGRYVALENTFTSGQTAATAGLQVRSRDGTLLYGHVGDTMAVWVGDQLFFRALNSTQVWRWDPASPAAPTAAFTTIAPWIRPKSGPQQDRVAFTWRDSSGLPHVRVVDTTGAVRTVVGSSGRSSAVYLGPWALFYIGESSCGDQCGPGPPSTPNGKTYVYDLKTGSESGSRLAAVYDVWSPPGTG